MEKYVIEGGHPLSGEIRVSGAKNAALKILAAAILSEEPCTITNMPKIEDINRLLEILKNLGAEFSWNGSTLNLSTKEIKRADPDPDLVRKLRSSIVLAGPLLARFGEVTMAHPGGCIIGKRPIDMFLEGFKALGAEILDHNDFYILKARHLKGAKIVLPLVSVTVTESMMMTACLAKGVTQIINAAMEPEITALADYLNACGAKISGAGTPEMIIEGVEKLGAGQYNLIPDRIEAGSLVVLGLLTGGKIRVTNCRPDHLEVAISLLQRAGADLEIGPDYILTKPSKFKGIELKTHEYPGFPTDLQAPFVVLLTQALGQSLVHETIFEGRLFYTDKLTQMGADIIMCDPHRVVVNGITKLRGKKLESPDLRAGMALLIAGLIAEGTTTIENIYQIERGYEDIVARLQSLGAKIKKVDDCLIK